MSFSTRLVSEATKATIQRLRDAGCSDKVFRYSSMTAVFATSGMCRTYQFGALASLASLSYLPLAPRMLKLEPYMPQALNPEK